MLKFADIRDEPLGCRVNLSSLLRQLKAAAAALAEPDGEALFKRRQRAAERSKADAELGSSGGHSAAFDARDEGSQMVEVRI
jgi:hypothetical protein